MAVPAARWERGLELAANASLVLIAVYVSWLVLRPTHPPPGPKVPTRPISLAGTQHVGSTSAPVALVIFSDFQCPFCAKFAQSILPVLMKKYVDSGKVLIGFRHFPNEAGHPLAMGAAAAAYCAGVQGKFWQLHDLFFQQPGSLSVEALRPHMAELGLDAAALETCIARGAESRVREDIKLGRTLGIIGTPTSFLGTLVTGGREGDWAVKVGTIIPGSPDIAVFEKVMDKVLGQSVDAASKR